VTGGGRGEERGEGRERERQRERARAGEGERERGREGERERGREGEEEGEGEWEEEGEGVMDGGRKSDWENVRARACVRAHVCARMRAACDMRPTPFGMNMTHMTHLTHLTQVHGEPSDKNHNIGATTINHVSRKQPQVLPCPSTASSSTTTNTGIRPEHRKVERELWRENDQLCGFYPQTSSV
jgi:hypothetical protein